MSNVDYFGPVYEYSDIRNATAYMSTLFIFKYVEIIITELQLKRIRPLMKYIGDQLVIYAKNFTYMLYRYDMLYTERSVGTDNQHYDGLAKNS